MVIDVVVGVVPFLIAVTAVVVHCVVCVDMLVVVSLRY